MRVAAMISVLLAMLVATTGHAETPMGAAAPTLGRALKPSGRLALQSGLDRLGPALVGRILSGFESQASVQPLLQEQLAKLGAKLEIADLATTHAGFVFVAGDGLSPAGEVLVQAIAKARFEGIDIALPEVLKQLAKAAPVTPPTIPAGALEAAWSEAAGSYDGSDGARRFDAAAKALAKKLAYTPTTSASIEARVAAEVALTDALATLIAGLPARPRVAPVLEDERGNYLSPDVVWQQAPAAKATAEQLSNAIEVARAGRLAEHLASLTPTHPQYAALVAAAERYEKMCAEGAWPEVALPKNAKAPLTPELVKPLQTRLAREGFFQGAPTGEWDAATQAAVLEVRRVRHLKDKTPDFDKDLVRVLSVPCEERVATLILNVKRWRVSSWNGERESVQVNLAGQLMRYFRDDALVMSQRTVVGSDRGFFSKSLGRKYFRNSTPILHDSIATVIVNPEWNVPGRIAREELEPEMQKDPTYVTKNRFKTKVGGDGVTYYIQESGPGNALGRIKILFPNSESVYLHDTPGRAAFNLPIRALSHGCVRVNNAVDFGAELIRSDKQKSGEAFEVQSIKDFVAGSRQMRVFDLAHEIPVFLEYYTASVDEAGVVWFHPDVYAYDAETFHPSPPPAP